ncbi:MAG TPA: M48 family metalloprotease [Thermoanaerobaculia bacterium]|nr:M48 family metalloprotease [Thermoanaerobaculia bacterium]
MRVAVAILLLLCSWGVVAAESLDDFDVRIERELRAQDVRAAEIWAQANAARAAQKFEESAALYAQVYARVPSFVHALRRQGTDELAAGDRAAALGHLRAALAQSNSGENMAALALALVETGEGETPERDAQEAKELARKAAELDSKDSFELTVLARVAERTRDLPMLREAADRLATHAPNELATHMMRMTVAANDGDFDEAFAALDRARGAGLPQETYEEIVKSLNDARPLWKRWWKTAAWILGGWLAGFGVLLLVGTILSRMAVRAAEEPVTDLSANATSLSTGLRRTYAGVLFLTSVFYYLSLPIIMLLVLGIGGAIIYGFIAAGHIPIKLVFLVAVVVGISIWSMLKSVFARRNDEDPGLKLDLGAEPRLREALDSVAARIGTRPVDNVYLTPAMDMAVMERRGKERCLILGVAALDGLALRPFKAILGHEYGHFVNRDTAGGAFALSVRRSISLTAIGIAQGGAAAWYNPAWLFVTSFHRVFLRISEGASRLQEVLADRWAVFAYGAQAFEDGLRHIVVRGAHFDAHVGVTIKEVVDAQVPLSNLYTYKPSAAVADVTDAIHESLNREASAYDSHPSPVERFRLVHALPQPDVAAEADDAMPAWSLFQDPLAMQQLMTEQVRANVRANYGVEIVAPATV